MGMVATSLDTKKSFGELCTRRSVRIVTDLPDAAMSGDVASKGLVCGNLGPPTREGRVTFLQTLAV